MPVGFWPRLRITYQFYKTINENEKKIVSSV